jgi:hypothetical protein
MPRRLAKSQFAALKAGAEAGSFPLWSRPVTASIVQNRSGVLYLLPSPQRPFRAAPGAAAPVYRKARAS